MSIDHLNHNCQRCGRATKIVRCLAKTVYWRLIEMDIGRILFGIQLKQIKQFQSLDFNLHSSWPVVGFDILR